MSRRRYAVWNAATAALTAAPTAVTTGTAIKTMLQVKPTTPIVIVEWGYSFDVVPTALVRVELVTTGTVNATVTQFAAGDVVKYDDPSHGRVGDFARHCGIGLHIVGGRHCDRVTADGLSVVVGAAVLQTVPAGPRARRGRQRHSPNTG
jgi:hypothetical protein